MIWEQKLYISVFVFSRKIFAFHRKTLRSLTKLLSSLRANTKFLVGTQRFFEGNIFFPTISYLSPSSCPFRGSVRTQLQNGNVEYAKDFNTTMKKNKLILLEYSTLNIAHKSERLLLLFVFGFGSHHKVSEEL